ncbi:trichohyalin [Mugil cephalus]|uniref:trichohyalin n=1 Tax=Mugil cephalus TaxID=48193 RepID=UPI001FB77F6F|nr:trichohyalin [Mugil cephalus]
MPARQCLSSSRSQSMASVDVSMGAGRELFNCFHGNLKLPSIKSPAALQDMAGRGRADAEDTDTLLHTDFNDSNSTFDCPPLKLDHCDLLLDAMDAQLSRLQVQPWKREAVSKEADLSNTAPFGWSQSLSKDTGLGSTSQTNDTPMCCFDLVHTPTREQTSGSWEDPVTHEETNERLDRWTRDREETESRREQVIWRLERLLGDSCNDGRMAEETHPPSDSICTEDFGRRFREEMVEMALPDSAMQQLDKEEEAERTDISDSDTHQIPPRAGVVTDHGNIQYNNSCSPRAKCLAGVPVRSFDTVSIDSDLDTVCTEHVRQHIHKRSGWRSLIHSVTNMNDHCTTQSDYDTATQEESESQSTSVQRSPHKRVHNRSLSLRKAQRNKKETHRTVCSLSDNDKDTDEEMNPWRRKSNPERTSEKLQSDWTKMKEQLRNLQQKCEREEETLRMKRAHLKDVELCLSELQQKRKHALQELKRLTSERSQMEKERKSLESNLRERHEEKESISCQLQTLQRQKESCLLEVRGVKEDLATLTQRKQTLTDGSYMSRNNVMSVLEREEMERQLDSTKTELFAEQRCAREKLECMQERLEETREELHSATETVNSLRNRCSCLEDEHMQKKGQTETLEVQVSELHGDLGRCKIRLGTLEKTLAQKELQLLHVQEQYEALQAERDGLRGELEHLKTQHYEELKEAQEQTHMLMVNKQSEEEKTRALKEETLALTQRIEFMQSSIQRKEEEVIKLRKSLRQQKEEAKKHEEDLEIEATKKAHEAVEEEQRKWEEEKVESMQVHCGILEEQHRKSLESLRSEMQREKSKALASQHQVLELKKKVQELESERDVQQKEQQSLMAAICKSLKEEHQAELQQSQRYMAQSQKTALRLQQDVRLAVEENDRLRVMLEEKESSHNLITAEMEQQLGAECQHLHLLLEQSGAKHSSGGPPLRFTVTEALTNLRTLREQLKIFISRLLQELVAQKQTNDQLRQDKERELSIQRQQLRVERDQALSSIKKRLIQDHIEELSSLKWAQMSDGGAEGGAASSLRRQLKDKDLELVQVQRSMAEWKENTAARLACKFEEELTTELERCKAKLLRGRKASKTREERQRKFDRSDGAKETQKPACGPSLHAVDSAASHGPSDVASLKLLSYLQSRVKQLRVENQAHTWSPPPRATAPVDLSGSYLNTIAQGQDSAGILNQSSGQRV